MNEKENKIFKNLTKLISNATESQKDYLIGLTDGMALASEGKKKQNRRAKPNK